MLSKVFSSRLLVSNRHECTIMGSACGREGTPRSFGYGLTVSCPVLWIAPLCRKMYLYTFPNPEKGLGLVQTLLTKSARIMRTSVGCPNFWGQFRQVYPKSLIIRFAERHARSNSTTLLFFRCKN